MAGRPAKPVKQQSGTLTKENRERRQLAEDSICSEKGNVMRSTMKLTKKQKAIRRKIVEQIRDTLRDTDRFILDQCAIAIDRLQTLEQEINDNPEVIFRKNFISIKKEYFSEFVRLCGELSLSPQARAKLANARTPEKKNPLEGLVGSDDEDAEQEEG